MGLDLEPDLVAGLGRPQGGGDGAGIARDHARLRPLPRAAVKRGLSRERDRSRLIAQVAAAAGGLFDAKTAKTAKSAKIAKSAALKPRSRLRTPTIAAPISLSNGYGASKRRVRSIQTARAHGRPNRSPRAPTSWVVS
jgi:hypothetical protein